MAENADISAGNQNHLGCSKRKAELKGISIFLKIVVTI
jgi:hypothetical protein